MTNYPMLKIDLNKLNENARTITQLAASHNVKLSCVIKGCNADETIVSNLLEYEMDAIASSRIHHLKSIKSNHASAKTLLLKLPMISEIQDVIDYADISLNSEMKTIEMLNDTCIQLNKKHKIILMVDLGDLREGIWDEGQVYEMATYIEDKLKGIELAGVGTNLGCYGSIVPTIEKMDTLSKIAKHIEKLIGRKLEYVSGGGTTTLPLLLDKNMPTAINHLRIGEAILLGQDLPKYFDFKQDHYNNDVIVLEAEVIEIKEKPSFPVGLIGVDAFGNKPKYVDKGPVIRALLAAGKQDFGDHEKIEPIEKDLSIIGSSSDHLIVELENPNHHYKLGDIMHFRIYYQAMLQCFISNQVDKIYI